MLLAQAAAAAASPDHSLLLGTGGVAGVLAIGCSVLWLEYRSQRKEHAEELKALNQKHAEELKAAGDKLDKFQDRRIEELNALNARLSSGGDRAH